MTQELFDAIRWINKFISSPDRLTNEESEELFRPLKGANRKNELRWFSWGSAAPGNIAQSEFYMQIPIPPLLRHAPMTKVFTVATTNGTSRESLDTSAKQNIVALPGNRVVHVWFQFLEIPSRWVPYQIFVVIMPDIRDLERIYGNSLASNDAIDVEGLPLGEQLSQELEEARVCRDNNLTVATIATLSIALETACKITLETNQIAYKRNSDGLNQLLEHLVKNTLLSERDRQSALALKGLRNAVAHAHTGVVRQSDSDVFFVSGEQLIKTILQNAR